MKTSKLLFGTLTLALLTACGGGSGDNSPNPSTPNNNRPNNNVSGSFQGQALTVANGSTANFSNRQNVGSNSLTTLNVGGKQIPLQLPGIYSGGMTHIQGNITGLNTNAKLFSVSGSKYQSSKFGYISQDGSDYIFSQGQRTANMPSSGRANYVGDATMGRSGEAVLGYSHFTADFGNKTLEGSITPERGSNLKSLDISATISGNGFSTANNAAVSSSGNFYGNNAAELGGIFTDSSQNIAGAFGGHKQ